MEIILYVSLRGGKKSWKRLEFGLPPQILLSHPKTTSLNENPLEKWEEGLRRKGEVASLLQFILIQEEETVGAAGCWREMQTIVSAIEKYLGHPGSMQVSTGDFLGKQGESTWSPCNSVSVYRIGKIDDIVRLDALKIAQIIKGAIERGFFQVIVPPLERFRVHFSQPYSMLLPCPI